MNNETENEVEYSYPLETSYIDLYDLIEVLRDYFTGQLDKMEPYLSRLYLPPRLAHPFNTLWGQLDNDTITDCLKELLKIDKDSYELLIEIHRGSKGEVPEDLIPDYMLAMDKLGQLVHKKL